MVLTRSFLGGCLLVLTTSRAAGFAPSLQSRSTLLTNTSPLYSTTEFSSDLVPGVEAIQQHNAELLAKLQDLKDSNYFKLFSVDILGSCEYMAQELFECYTESCEIYPIEDEQVPSNIKEVDQQYAFELDGFARWDMPTDDYYDIQEFVEGYTGYDGSEVWGFIHNQICFPEYGYGNDHWKADFNKAVSGMHAMISAQIIRGISEKLDSGEAFTAEERWTDPSMEYSRRLTPNGETPQAVENLYFLAMLLLRAVAISKERILDDQKAGFINDMDSAKLHSLFDAALLSDGMAENVKIASQKFRDHATKDKETVEGLWEARMRTRELLRVMNCVQCNKCRLHGKIAAMGVSTALQILVGWTGEGQDPRKVQRVEIATLMTTLDKCSRAIDLCLRMQS